VAVRQALNATAGSPVGAVVKRASTRVGWRVAALLTAAIWAHLFHVSQARAEVTTIRLGHIGFPGSLFDIVAQEYARYVNAQLKDRYVVKVFDSSQLGSYEQMAKGIVS
jgi:TRAP-type C4-dicarboxylate transport system substrate-binding protein